MVNLITAAFLLLFFFGFVFNSTDWCLKTMIAEDNVLKTRAKQYQDQNLLLANSTLDDLKIGELE
jgi:hypothetical protein